MATSSIARAKQAVRERVWRALEDARVAPSGVSGHIPAFYDAPAAAERLSALELWRASRVVKAVPDRPQQPVRERALADGKLLYMAVPKLANILPFYELDPARLGVAPAQAANKDGAALAGTLVSVTEMQPIDVIVTGCVAVDRNGARLGKGAGYSDIEVALLSEAGLIRDHTVIVTTVHPLQVVDESIPEASHDFHVDVIVTPHDVITTGTSKRGTGLDWESLTPEKISAIPLLARLARENGRFPA